MIRLSQNGFDPVSTIRSTTLMHVMMNPGSLMCGEPAKMSVCLEQFW